MVEVTALRFQNCYAVDSNKASYKPNESGRNLENFHIPKFQTVQKQVISYEFYVHFYEFCDNVREGHWTLMHKDPQGLGPGRFSRLVSAFTHRNKWSLGILLQMR